MKLYFLSLIIFVLGCSQTVEQYEFSGHKRVSYLDQNEKRPKFYYKPQKNIKRAPASIIEDVETNSSLRAVYFKAMWNQKKDFEKILGLEGTNYCPQFHHQVIQMKENNNNYVSLKEMTKKINGHRNPISYPVLALPYQGSDLYSYLQKENQVTKDEVNEAMQGFYKLTKNEVSDLCETGVSEGYFMTKNLADYYVRDSEFRRSENYIEAMLKTPFIANLYVLKSFKKTKIDLNDSPEVLHHLNANWLIGYLEKMTMGHNKRLTRNEKVQYE
jgi:hypothetical protein